MRHFAFLSVLGLSLLLVGCGGSGGGRHITTVTGAQFQISWPARTRGALQNTLTSSESASIVFQKASASSTDVVVNVDRDLNESHAYTGTYSIPTAVSPQHAKNVAVTFYAQPAEAGAVVGTANASATITGSTVSLATISLTGSITKVTVVPTTLTQGAPSQLLPFTASDASNATIAVAAGSASWAITSGTSIGLTSAGVATPLSIGNTVVTATVDGVVSAPATISVDGVPSALFSWAGAKGGTLTVPTFDVVEGNKFQVSGTHNVLVTALAYEQDQPNQPATTVAIFDSTGAVLTSATVGTTDTLQNGYYYKSITPTTLTAGQIYYIGGLHGTGSTWSYYHATATATVPPFITDLGTVFKITSTIDGAAPWQNSGPRNYTTNMTAQEVP